MLLNYINKTAAEVLPPTVKGELQGEGLVLEQLFNALPFLIIAAVFVMYVILGILYESYVHPVTVLSTLFPAVVGGLMTLWLFSSTLSLYSVIGLFLLMGIVKKNGIMIVDFALHRLDEGYDRRAAIHEASVERFRPIIMTTLAALMGALPIALGFGADGSSRRPLGLVIVGGLIVSQLITLYITPVIYLALEWFQESVLDRVPVPAQRAHSSRSRRRKARHGVGTRAGRGELSARFSAMWEGPQYPDGFAARQQIGALRPLPRCLTRSDPLHRLRGQPVERLHRPLEMLLFRVLDLVVTDPVQTLHEHHHRRHTGARHFRGVVQRAGRQAMRLSADLANRFIAKFDQLVVERHRLDLPESLPRDGHVSFLRKPFARFPRLAQHRRQRRRIEMALIERDPAFLHHAGHDAWLRQAGADRANAAVAFGDAINLRTHLRRGEKSVFPPVHRRAPGMRCLPVKGDGVPLHPKGPEDRA